MTPFISDPQQWATAHFGAAPLGEPRRTRRLVHFAAAMAEDPAGSIPRICGNWSDTKAAYRLFCQPQVTFDAVCQPHFDMRQQAAGRRFPLLDDTNNKGGNSMTARLLLTVAAALTAALAVGRDFPPVKLDPTPKPIQSDPSVKLDYDIVYVRAPRFVAGRDGKQRPSAWPEIAHPTNVSPGYDLMLLHPDGKEEVLVEGGEGSVADLFVSFDAEWVYYAHFYLGKLGTGSDIYKVHVKSKKIVRLTHQEQTPNTAALDARKTAPPAVNSPIGRGVFNLGPCPLPPSPYPLPHRMGERVG